MFRSTLNSRAARRSNKGFTLVEILIVVIILGILASIVVAQFTNVRGSTSDTALKDNLRWMRSAILLYQAEHGSFPTLANFQGQMTSFTDLQGSVSATRDATHKYGSYMLSLPPLPIGVQKGQSAVTGTTYAANYGWQYDETSGTIRPNCQDSETDADGTAYNTY
ncbi:MAG TPA: prepilin-type N-terminal cleavage/methylation domain-containing protein [Tepidisphaeraceae bacterium]